MNADDRKQLTDKCEELCSTLKSAGILASGDLRDNYSPGWKFNHWELKGVPIRIELGPRDVARQEMVTVRRDTGDKSTIKLNDAVDAIKTLLDDIHNSLFAKAKKDYDSNTATCYEFEDFCNNLDLKKVILAPFCGGIPCEENIKKLSARDAVTEEGGPAMGAKGLCIPFKQPADIKDSDKCIGPNCTGKPLYYTLFGRSY
jgi:bifunctional glutamyl/prolyl-tRNA synthetase